MIKSVLYETRIIVVRASIHKIFATTQKMNHRYAIKWDGLLNIF